MRITPHDNRSFRRVHLVRRLGNWDGGPSAALLYLSDILTLDDLPEEQPPMWHASVALVRGERGEEHGDIFAYADLPELAQAAMRARAVALLNGVGTGDVTLHTRVSKSLHARVGLTAAELAVIRRGH